MQDCLKKDYDLAHSNFINQKCSLVVTEDNDF